MAPIEDIDLSTIDLYELLAIQPTASESEVRRAYRKTSLLYHPDKVEPTPENLNKFQLLQHAIAVLSDPTEKSKYDSGREAKLRRVAENAALESRRRKMKEDLEKREVGVPLTGLSGNKRTWSDRELAIKRIAEENRKRKEAAMAKKVEEVKKAETVVETPSDAVERSVKVRWVKEGEGLDIDDEVLKEMFPVGDVEDVVLLKDKKRKIDGRDKKVILGTAVVVFKLLATAKQVVARGKTGELESVTWAAEKEKDAT